jgi:hypothetical protein
MKKVVLIFAIALFAVGCRDEKQQEVALTPDKEKELISFFSKRDLLRSDDCGEHLVVISKNSFVDSETDETEAQALYATFIAENKDFISTSSIGNKQCGTNTSYFNIIKYIARKRDIPKTEFAKWLHKNGKGICFKDMYPLIECVHRIEDKKVISQLKALLDGEVVKQTLTFQEIKDKVIAENGKYEEDCYENYLNFIFDFDNVITFKLNKTYKPTGDYYSIPFIRSIYENHKTEILLKGMDTELIFFQAPLFSDVDQVVMAIKLDNGNYIYYDFSQIPPVYGGLSSYYSFSPL